MDYISQLSWNSREICHKCRRQQPLVVVFSPFCKILLPIWVVIVMGVVVEAPGVVVLADDVGGILVNGIISSKSGGFIATHWDDIRTLRNEVFHYF